MRKKQYVKKIISALLILTMLLGGCAAGKDASGDHQKNAPGDTAKPQSESEDRTKEQPEEQPPAQILGGGASGAENTAVLVTAADTKAKSGKGSGSAASPIFDLSGVQGKIKNIYYAHGSRVVVSADKLYLYDYAKGRILAETASPFTDVYDFKMIDDGYAVIGEETDSAGGSGMMAASGGSGTQCVFYDGDLQRVSEVSVNKIHKKGHSVTFGDAIAISGDGGKLAFSTQDGLYLYDRNKKKKKTLINLNSNPKKIAGICGIIGISFTNEDQSIAFHANTFDIPVREGNYAYPTCGLVNVDGKGLVNKKTGDFTIYEMKDVYDTFALYQEGFLSPSGRILKMDIPSGKTGYLSVSKRKESGSIYGSDGGAYYTTSVLSDTGLSIRIYDTKTGKLAYKKFLKSNGTLQFAREPRIHVIDGARICIVLLGASQSDLSTKVWIKQF